MALHVLPAPRPHDAVIYRLGRRVFVWYHWGRIVDQGNMTEAELEAFVERTQWPLARLKPSWRKIDGRVQAHRDFGVVGRY